jgi:hypothetical protein
MKTYAAKQTGNTVVLMEMKGAEWVRRESFKCRSERDAQVGLMRAVWKCKLLGIDVTIL